MLKSNQEQYDRTPLALIFQLQQKSVVYVDSWQKIHSTKLKFVVCLVDYSLL